MGDQSHHITRRTIIVCAMFAAFALPATSALAQGSSFEQRGLAARPLPDAPDFAVAIVDSSSIAPLSPPISAAPSNSIVASSIAAMPVASKTQKYIEPDQIAPTLSTNDKALLGLRDAFSPFAAVGWFASADYEQLINGSPNFGSDGGAYGQRLGAAAVRDSSEGVFSDSVMSSFFHEDPRYYRMGPTHHFLVRFIYSGTRPIFTRTDGGHSTPNLAFLSGTMGGAALTNLYYPQVNRGISQTLQTFGGSLGGAALGDVVSEFYADFKHMLHPAHDPGAHQ
jgi:hypothetical protein